MTAALTVGYVGNFRHPWCTEVHVAGSLGALGHRVVRLQEDTIDWPAVPDLLDAEGAQLLLWTRTWPQAAEVVRPVLDELRARGVPSVSYHLDRWFGLNREHQVRDQPFFMTDLVVSPDDSPRWADEGVNHLWQPPGVFHAECEPVPPNPRRWPADVVFVGSYPYPHPEWADYRHGLIEAFKAEFGKRFEVLPGARRVIRNRALQELYATAKVVVGDSCLAGESHRYWSDRIPETLGRGGLLIHPDVPGLDAWYTNHSGMAPGSGTGDLLTYELGRYDQALVLAQWALDNPTEAQQVRDHGRATVLARDTYVHRLATVLDHVQTGWSLHPEGSRAPAKPPSPPGRIVVQSRRHRVRATFQLAQGDTDRTAVAEVWETDDYRLQPQQLRRKTVVDIGANVGAFSVLAAKLGAARVLAYEPHPVTVEALRTNVAHNNVPAVEVHQLAVVGPASLQGLCLVGDGGGAHLVPTPHIGDEQEHQAVDAVTLADVLAEAGPVALLKIDTEGAEYAMLDALDGEALTGVERIAMEFHGPGMPHLTHLDADGGHAERWGRLVTKLANYGRVEVFGRPMVGGLIWWARY